MQKLKPKLNSSRCSVCSNVYKNSYVKGIYIDLAPCVCSTDCLYNLINDSNSTTYTEQEIKLLGIPFGKPNKSIYDFRSALELEFISALYKIYQEHDKHLPKIEYEPYLFTLSENKSYVPDFLIHDSLIFFEIKGLWELGARKKVQQFTYFYPFKFYLIDSEFIAFMKRGAW